jgi:transcription elongation factor GreA
MQGRHERHEYSWDGPPATKPSDSGINLVCVSFLVRMTEESTFLTPAALKKIEAELEQLRTEGRREIEERMAEARSHGDIRENADYDAAKNDQGLMEARIRKLEHVVSTAEVREVEDTGRVEVGCVVTVIDSDGDEIEYFVAAQENKIAGLILASPESPLGSALLGKSAGDEVQYEAPAGTMTVTVKEVRPYDG